MSFWDFLPSLFLMIKTPPPPLYWAFHYYYYYYYYYFKLWFEISSKLLKGPNILRNINVWSCFRKPPRKLAKQPATELTCHVSKVFKFQLLTQGNSRTRPSISRPILRKNPIKEISNFCQKSWVNSFRKMQVFRLFLPIRFHSQWPFLLNFVNGISRTILWNNTHARNFIFLTKIENDENANFSTLLNDIFIV